LSPRRGGGLRKAHGGGSRHHRHTVEEVVALLDRDSTWSSSSCLGHGVAEAVVEVPDPLEGHLCHATSHLAVSVLLLREGEEDKCVIEGERRT
jgi:hypothetical protein